MYNIIFIQARMSSNRFPHKMLKKINSFTLLELVYNRCKALFNMEEIIILTSNDKTDDILADFCEKNKIKVFRGDLNNVLKRFSDAINFFKIPANTLVCRVCGDSPFIDIYAIEEMFKIAKKEKLDYIRSTGSLNGFIAEIIDTTTIHNLLKKNLSNSNKEHVTEYIIQNLHEFKTKYFTLKHNDENLHEYTLTVDYPDDIIVVNEIFKKINNFLFSSEEILKILRRIKENK